MNNMSKKRDTHKNTHVKPMQNKGYMKTIDTESKSN